ncbi:rRNA maturation RNase YbeY [Saccharicrinis carchari]|uniref:Endoribonuclease YbeY n=1 Tax=Saccharicrinis carchari TaxID=1168039 RepID=A0A521CIX4_SACCC|nr:rRNA maturation RNase YbeY [Saccharicrinis carchari]SMO58650.1 rRNA maturation RNase YbeY [Saccharicrinis carchari]
MINYSFEDIKDIKLNKDLIDRWIIQLLANDGWVAKEISFIFCSDAYILKINKAYLQHNYYTDIITFDYCIDSYISGDIFISLDTVRNNADDYNTTFKQELYRVIIHGILHLMGFKDKTPQQAAIMRQKEEEALALLKTI